ncbi:uncharacterized protein LOC114848077 [Betta splendens]|uniref:Uncharacterized protein LOC114848077 n=1 Tax=Betta splendens TaxID=158456 RepID=A0A6P7LIT9_BETSP|nr:uncharacterized protein LOC114848077 [Betta splendens]
MPGQSKGRGRQTEARSCPPKQNEALPGLVRKIRARCALNEPLYCTRTTLRITQHPIVGSVTPSATFTPTQLFFPIFIHLFTCLFQLYSLPGVRKRSCPTTNGCNGFGASTHPLSSQQQTVSEADSARLAAKTLNMPQHSGWVLKAGAAVRSAWRRQTGGSGIQPHSPFPQPTHTDVRAVTMRRLEPCLNRGCRSHGYAADQNLADVTSFSLKIADSKIPEIQCPADTPGKREALGDIGGWDEAITFRKRCHLN